MIKPLMYLFILLPACVANAQNHAKSESGNSEMHVRSTADFELSGDGAAEAWKTTAWTPVVPRNGAKPGYQTQVKLLYSPKGIYCLFSSEDRKITATLATDFSDLYNEDVVEIFFWPDEAYPIYFEYELSPLNHELAILVPNIHGNFYGWRPWNYEGDRATRHATKVHNDEKGVSSWTAEFFIPFALLTPLVKKAPEKGSRWRANMYRIDYDDGAAHFSWQPTRKNFHDYEKFGTIIFD